MDTIISLIPFGAGLVALALSIFIQRNISRNLVRHFARVEPTLSLPSSALRTIGQRFEFDSDYLLSVTSIVALLSTGVGLSLAGTTSLAGSALYLATVALYGVLTVAFYKKYYRQAGVYLSRSKIGISPLSMVTAIVNILGAVAVIIFA